MSIRRVTAQLQDFLTIACFAGASWMTWSIHPAARHLRAEIRVRQCAAQLHRLGTALLAYQRDHGRLPQQLGLLYPHYVPDARDFTCPSAAPRIRSGKAGYGVRIGGSYTASAYILEYLSDGYGDVRRRRSRDAPLIVCAQHVLDVTDETWGQVTYGRAYTRRHGDPPYLVLRADGRVDRVPFSEVWRRGWTHSSEF